MRSAAVLLICTGLMSLTATPTRAQADWVLHNALIYTINPEQPTAEALAVRDGRILMVGTDGEVLGAYPDARRMDAGSRTVIPGFIDAHAHLMGLGVSLLRVDLVGTGSKGEVIERLEAFVQEQNLPEGVWLVGRGWDQNDWPIKEFPTREVLDAAFPERPVWLVRVDGHAGWANSAALRAAGLNSLRRADAPKGGEIMRAENGRPTGIFLDTAMRLVASAIPPFTEAQREKALHLALQETRRFGLTGVHDAGAGLETIRLYKKAIDAGWFDLRVYAMIDGRGAAFDHFCQEGPLLGYEGRLTVRAVKFYMDGALGSRGAALLEPYSDDPGNRGLLRQEPEAFTRDVIRAMECGFQVATHAIGDRANRVVLDAYEQAMAAAGNTAGRHRIEHAQILAPQDLPRFSALDVIASMQPTHATSDMPWADERLGEERLKGAYAWNTLLKSGAHLAFGSDFPVEDVNPLEGFYAAVTRQDASGRPEGGWFPEERVSRKEALRAFTLGAAYAAFQEDQVGSIEPGKRADFVILSKDIMQVPASQILKTEVRVTFLGGKKIYSDE